MRSDPEVQGASSTTDERRLLALVLERVSDAFVALDREGRYTYVNPRAEQVFGLTAQQMLGQSIWKLFPEVVDQPFYRAFLRAGSTQEFTFVESFYPPWERWFENRIYPSADGFSIFFHDVTERKRGEALLIAQSQMLESIAHGAPLTQVLTTLVQFIESQCPGTRGSVLLLDNDGKHLRHGAAPSLPLSFTHAVDGAAIGPMAGSCGAAAFHAEPVMTEDIATHPNWIVWKELALPLGLRACWSSPIFDDQRQVLGTFALYYASPGPQKQRPQRLIDMATHIASIAISKQRAETERRERETMLAKNRELEEQNRATLEAFRLKNEFLSNMSHELRTPLNAILGFSEFLTDETAGPLNPKQLECLGHVISSGRHLLGLINDMLDLTRLEAGKVALFPVDFRLLDVLEEVWSVVRTLADGKSITLNMICDPSLDRVLLDPQKLRQVVFNLLANAVKFTPREGSVALVAQPLDTDWIEIRVLDSGIGIRAEDIPNLFQELRQLDTGTNRRHEGSGLGLALAKRLVEIQGGRIGVESRIGEGSEFYVVLPRALRLSAAQPA